MTGAGAKRNKARGASDEREVARILGGRRHLADTGGPEDVAHPLYAVQVKGGKAVVTSTMRAALEQARRAAEGTDKLPAVVLIDRRGTRVQRWIAFPLEAYADRDECSADALGLSPCCGPPLALGDSHLCEATGKPGPVRWEIT